MMEVKQFYHKTISPLCAKTFPCKWSQDNRLSIVTEKVVHVFEIQPAPYQATPILDLSRSFLNSPKTLPCDFYAEEILSNIFEWKREDVFSFLMNDVHTPSFPKAKVLKPEITNVFWSPKGLLHPQKCLLAVLTSAGSLEITVQIQRNWFSIHELYKDWYKIIDEDFQNLKETTEVDAECLKEQLNRLLVTDATWSNLCHQDNISFAYLVTAHRNAEIVIWKIHSVLNDIVHINTCVNVEFKFRKKLINNSIKINTMLWVDLGDNKYLLFVGFFNGQIGVLMLQEFEGGLTSNSFNICYSDEDSISVEYMEILQHTNKQLDLLVIKGMYLLILTVDIFGKMINMKFVTSPGFSITGVSIIDSNNILMTTQDGKICMIKRSISQELTRVPVKSDIAKDALQYLGFTSSQNKLLFVLVSSPSVMYDHLRNREPTNLCFFTFNNVESQDLVKRLHNNEEQTLINNWDYLELIKVNALKRGTLPVMTFKTENLDLIPLHELKGIYWILNIMETVKKKNSTEEYYSEPKEIEQVKTYIFLYSASLYLRHLTQQKILTDTQKLSMSLLRIHLDIWFAGEEEEAETPLSIVVKDILDATSKFDLIEQEKCGYCKKVITEPWADSCPQGHKLTRCALTRLQVPCIKYRTCPICQEIYHPCLEDEMNEVVCIYCDVPVIYMYFKMNSELVASTRNLSKDKLIFIGSNKDKDKDKDEEDDTND